MPTLEIIWQQDATAPCSSRAVPDDSRTGERQIDAAELVRFADAPPDGLELGGSARTTFAIVELAHRGVAEGLVHPYLEHSNGAWHAFWGSTLDATVQKALTRIAAALPEVCAAPFDGDRDAVVHDLYPVPRRPSRARPPSGGPGSADPGTPAPAAQRPQKLFLAGLVAAESSLPPHSGYAALRRRVSGWSTPVSIGRSSAPWEARPAPRRAAGSEAGGGSRDRARALAAGGRRSNPRPARLASLGVVATRCTRSCVRATRAAI